MIKATTFVKKKRRTIKIIFYVFSAILFVLAVCAIVFHEIKHTDGNKKKDMINYMKNYCRFADYTFFALAPSVISLLFGSVFLYIKYQFKKNNKKKFKNDYEKQLYDHP